VREEERGESVGKEGRMWRVWPACVLGVLDTLVLRLI